jgi:hypothetical protein
VYICKYKKKDKKKKNIKPEYLHQFLAFTV